MTFWIFYRHDQRLADHFESNPSLRNPEMLASHLAKAFKYAVIGVQRETGMPRSALPKECPYSFTQILDEAFYPDATTFL